MVNNLVTCLWLAPGVLAGATCNALQLSALLYPDEASSRNAAAKKLFADAKATGRTVTLEDARAVIPEITATWFEEVADKFGAKRTTSRADAYRAAKTSATAFLACLLHQGAAYTLPFDAFQRVVAVFADVLRARASASGKPTHKLEVLALTHPLQRHTDARDEEEVAAHIATDTHTLDTAVWMYLSARGHQAQRAHLRQKPLTKDELAAWNESRIASMGDCDDCGVAAALATSWKGYDAPFTAPGTACRGGVQDLYADKFAAVWTPQ